MSVLDERKFSVPQAAKALGVCSDVVYDMIRKGEIQVLRIGKKFIITQSELERVCEDAVYIPPTKADKLPRPRRTTAADVLPAHKQSSTKDLDACLQRIRTHSRIQRGSDKDGNIEDSGNTKLS
ncbi:MAG: helix-turn-helix domain-containing protein [Planctomycetes bacterium]|nr:helix-turn-helix domain-containing protein [Planctomycetota bacterium]